MSTTTTIKVGESGKTITLQEGKALTLEGAAGSAGVAYLLDPVLGGTNSVKSWAIGAGKLAPIGAFEGAQKILITCSAGSINATAADAVLGAAPLSTPIALPIIGKPSGKPFPLDRRNATSRVLLMQPAGRMGTLDNSTQKTFQYTKEIPAGAIGFRPIFANTHGDYSPYVLAIKACVLADLSTAAAINNSAGSWTQILTSADNPLLLETAPLAGSVTARVAYSVPDYINISTLPRTDGGTAHAISIRCYLDADPALPVSGDLTGGIPDNFTNWATRTDGQRCIMRQQNGDCVTDPTTFTSTVNVSQCPIVGIDFLFPGKGKTVGRLSDSIVDGRANDNGGCLGDSYVSKAIKLLRDADPTGPVITDVNFGWAGQPANGVSGFLARGMDIIGSVVQPNVLVFSAGSINDVISAAAVAAWKTGTLKLIDKCLANRVEPVLVTLMASSYTGHPNGALDALRLEHNAWLLATCAVMGIRCVDVATPMAGSIEAHGQQELNPLYTGDGVHPNMAGDAMLAVLLAPVLREAVEL